jgi:hypothetical protein
MCLGPNANACTWFIDTACTQNTEGLYPLVESNVGEMCDEGETTGWCGEGYSQLYDGKAQSKCIFTSSVAPTILSTTTTTQTTAPPSAPPLVLPTWRVQNSYGPWFDTGIASPSGGRLVYLATFGMSPSAWDNGGALQNALNYCAYTLRSACTLILPQTGPDVVYRFRSGLYFGNLVDFTLDGGGSSFLFSRDKIWQTSKGSNNPLIQITSCTRMLIRNLVIDWDWRQWRLASLVRLVAATPTQWTVQFLELSQVDLDTIFTFQSFHQTERVTGDGIPGIGVEGGRPAMGTRNGAEIYFMDGVGGFSNSKRAVDQEAAYRKKFKIPSEASVVALDSFGKPNATGDDIGTEALGSNIVRITLLSASGRQPAIGAEFVAKHLVYEIPGISISSSSHVTLDNVFIQSTPGKGLTIGDESHHVYLNGLRISLPDTPREGTPRSISATADGIAIGGSQGFIRMNGVSIGWNGDDCINMYDPISADGFAVSVTNRREIYIRESPAWLISYYIGDTVEFMSDSFVTTGFRPKVTWAGLYGSTWTVQLSDAIPEDWTVERMNSMIVKNVRYNGGNIWINQLTCQYNRARGILIQVSNALLENSRFIHNQRAGIVIRASGYWGEGYGSNNVIVSNNLLRNMDRMGWSGWNEGGIVMDGERWWEGQGVTSSVLHTNVRIYNNQIENPTKKAMTLSSCLNLDVRGNKILALVDNTPEMSDRGQLILRRSTSVLVRENQFFRLNRLRQIQSGPDVVVEEQLSSFTVSANVRQWL